MLRNEAEIHAGLLIDLIATGALQIEHAGKQVAAAIQGDNPAHYAADFGIEKRSDQLLDQARAGNVVGVEDENNFRLHQLHGILQRGRLATLAFRTMEWLDASGKLRHKLVNDLASTIGRAVVYGDDLVVIVLESE